MRFAGSSPWVVFARKKSLEAHATRWNKVLNQDIRNQYLINHEQIRTDLLD